MDARSFDVRKQLETEGRVWFRGVVDGTALAALEQVATTGTPGTRWAAGDVLAGAVELTALAQRIAPGARPVRVVGFDKSRGANWSLPWHQDRVIAVRAKHAVPRFKHWTQKSGVWHVEAPPDLLQGMCFAYVHLDDADAANGCLHLALGTHRAGAIKAANADATANAAPQELCVAARGDVVFVKQLLLHRSFASQADRPRRTLRIDYAAQDLPPPLQWVTAAPVGDYSAA